MVDKKIMRSLLENLERAAEETLQRDAAFYEALRALKSEIDNDPMVQATVSELRAAGRSVFKSFTPRVRIRVRTEEGIFALPRQAEVPIGPPVEKVSRLVQELRNAASEVVRNSRHYHALDSIVNDVVQSNHRFEAIASQIESAGYEVLICLDLTAYAQVQGLGVATGTTREPSAPPSLPMHLSAPDLTFLKVLGISVEGT